MQHCFYLQIQAYYIYQDFSKADNNDFNSYEGSSVVVDTENKVAKIGVGTNKNNQGANTYFGNKTTKNTEVDFSKAVVTLNVKIDSKSMQDGQGFNWTVAVNEKVENSEAEEQKDESLNYAFKSERSVYIRKVGENVKVGYVWNGSSDEINQTATSNATAKILTDGNYDINFAFQTDENNVVTIKITVVNESGKTVFEEDNLVADGVLMEAMSVEDRGLDIEFNVFVYNVQPHVKIDYQTGKSSLDE